MRTILVLVAALCLAGCATTGPADTPPHALAKIDAARFYTGVWYEIGRKPMRLTDGCVAGGTRYERQGETRVQVVDFCHDKTPTGRLKTIGGPARIMDPGANAKLHVTYRLFGILPVPRDYWVLERADDYSWFISADPRFDSLWIYTRSSNPSRTEVETLTSRARALGYDTRRLEFPATSSQDRGA